MHTLLWYLILPLGTIMIMMFSVINTISIFFLSNDNNYLLPLPLKPWEIVTARFVVTLVYTYIFEVMMLLPIVVGYGIGSGGFIDYYLYSLVIMLVMPLIPISLLLIVLTYVTRVTNMAKHKDLFTYINLGFVLIFYTSE